MLRAIDWKEPAFVVLVDQTRLPGEVVTLELTSVARLADAVRRLQVRGAPALGVAGALGVPLALAEGARQGWSSAQVQSALDDLRRARPTAANLAWGVDQVSRHLGEPFDAVLEAALDLLAHEVRACRSIGERGADLLCELSGGGRRRPAPLRLHTHCNTGALACVEWGTALGVVRSLHARGLVERVVVDETRPLLQGARLTAWELAQEQIPYEVVVDAAGPGLVASGMVDAVVVGADRIAANGDVANKVGTYPLALAAARRGVPFVVAAPESTVDPATPDGTSISIEERTADEVVTWQGVRSAPLGACARNPAFDVTPAELVTAIVTEARVIRSENGLGPKVDP